jgi:hypothetical protein
MRLRRFLITEPTKTSSMFFLPLWATCQSLALAP